LRLQHTFLKSSHPTNWLGRPAVYQHSLEFKRHIFRGITHHRCLRHTTVAAFKVAIFSGASGGRDNL